MNIREREPGDLKELKRRILREEQGVELSLNATYATLHRLGYRCLAPRPRHEKQDLAAQETFKSDTAPFLSAPCGG